MEDKSQCEDSEPLVQTHGSVAGTWSLQPHFEAAVGQTTFLPGNCLRAKDLDGGADCSRLLHADEASVDFQARVPKGLGVRDPR